MFRRLLALVAIAAASAAFSACSSAPTAPAASTVAPRAGQRDLFDPSLCKSGWLSSEGRCL